jgi:predicted phosphodiesterase
MLKNTRDPELALWQSAVDEVVAKQAAGSQAQDIDSGAVIARPDVSQDMVAAAALDVQAAETGKATPLSPAAHQVAQDFGQVARYCSTLARNMVVDALKLDPTGASVNRAQLTAKMGDCDLRWVDAALTYKSFLASRQSVSYRVWSQIGDFVIDDALPAKARVAIVGDWGTGQDEAKAVLAQIARKDPDIVIHLGDIYYSCTDFEATNYFYNIWSGELDLKKVRTFTLAGNHDMFSGGAPFYRLLDRLGQKASYFCLRNEHWQFIALDTGFNDRVPGGTVPTFLQDTELAWLTDKIHNAGGRRTVLLSHHQLFSAFEDFAGGSVNTHLLSQVQALLPFVDVWLWGHEHNQTVYERFLNVLGRCIGHGAFPIGISETGPPKFPDVPMVPDIELGHGDAFMNHGYAVIDLDGDSAAISYFQDTDEDDALYVETLSKAQSAGG